MVRKITTIHTLEVGQCRLQGVEGDDWEKEHKNLGVSQTCEIDVRQREEQTAV